MGTSFSLDTDQVQARSQTKLNELELKEHSYQFAVKTMKQKLDSLEISKYFCKAMIQRFLDPKLMLQDT